MHLTYDYAINRLNLRCIGFIELIPVNEYPRRFRSVAPGIITVGRSIARGLWSQHCHGHHNIATMPTLQSGSNAGIFLGANSPTPHGFHSWSLLYISFEMLSGLRMMRSTAWREMMEFSSDSSTPISFPSGCSAAVWHGREQRNGPISSRKKLTTWY